MYILFKIYTETALLRPSYLNTCFVHLLLTKYDFSFRLQNVATMPKEVVTGDRFQTVSIISAEFLKNLRRLLRFMVENLHFFPNLLD